MLLAGPTNVHVFLGKTRHLGDFGPPDKKKLKQGHVILLCPQILLCFLVKPCASGQKKHMLSRAQNILKTQ